MNPFKYLGRLWRKMFPADTLKKLHATLQSFGLEEKDINDVVDTVVAAKKLPVDGNEKAQHVITELAHKGWSEELLGWASLIVKIAWAIAKLTGRI